MTPGQPPEGVAGRAPGSETDVSRRHPPEAFRPDLEGLRGVAILLVLLFHAGIPGIPGGFVGVDVFFVLSGFLITGLLIRERERTGRVSLPAFYARRARRILPAALVVAIATLLWAALVLPPLDILRAAEDAVSVALSVGNIRFAATATDYFAASGAPSPFLHYWSLGVEEQFYLLWPAILILATRFGRPRVGAGIVLAGVTAGSLALAIWLTGVAAPWAFYSLPTRAWQLGLGGLLAIVAVRPMGRLAGPLTSPRVAVIRAAAGWAGLAAVLAATVLIDSGTPYPGVAALLPAVGSAAIIASGGGLRWSVGRLLAIAPMRFLGRISYSLYLVHWPILVLPATGLALDAELPLEVRIGLALLSVVVGAVCWQLVESPIHHATRFRTQPWRALGVAAAAIATTLVVVFAVSAETSQSLDAALAAAPVESAAPSGAPGEATAPGSSQVAIAGLEPTAPPSPTPAPTPSPSGSPAPSSAPSPRAAISPSATPAATATASATAAATPAATPAPTRSPTPTPTPALTASPVPTPGGTPPPVVTPGPPGPGPDPNAAQPLPANVQPSLRNAAGDRERIEADGCELGNLAVQPPTCVYGDPNGSITVALVGDSHAAQWFPALDVLARRHGWRLVVFTKISCRFTDLPIYSRDMKREYTECEQWRPLVVARLQAIRPDLVIVSAAQGMATINPADDSPQRQGEGMARLLAQIPGRHAIIVDTPESHVDVPSCLSAHIADTRPCDTQRDQALGWRYLLLERTAARIDGATLINMTDVLCPGTICPAVLNGYIVLRDVFHLTATYAASLADELEPSLVRLAGG